MGNLIFKKEEFIRSYYDSDNPETSDYDIVLPKSVYSAIYANADASEDGTPTLEDDLNAIKDNISTVKLSLFGPSGTNTGSYLKSRLVGGGTVTITEDNTDPTLTKLVISSSGVDPAFIDELKAELERVIAIQVM